MPEQPSIWSGRRGVSPQRDAGIWGASCSADVLSPSRRGPSKLFIGGHAVTGATRELPLRHPPASPPPAGVRADHSARVGDAPPPPLAAAPPAAPPLAAAPPAAPPLPASRPAGPPPTTVPPPAASPAPPAAVPPPAAPPPAAPPPAAVPPPAAPPPAAVSPPGSWPEVKPTAAPPKFPPAQRAETRGGVPMHPPAPDAAPSSAPAAAERQRAASAIGVAVRGLTFLVTVAAHGLLLYAAGLLPDTDTLVVFVAGSILWESFVRATAARQPQLPANPFLNSTPVDTHWLRWLWPAPLLVPLRIALFFSCMLVAFVAAALRAEAVIRLLCRVVLYVFGFNWVRVKGVQVPRCSAPIIVANHRGPFEAVYLLSRHRCSMVAAGRNRLPGVGQAQDAMGFIYVDRDAAGSRRAVVNAIRDRAQSRSGSQVMVFPEGTTSNGSVLLTFKPGAFLPGCPVQPVCFSHPNETDDVDPSFTFGVRGFLPPMITTFLRLMCSWSNAMEVEYLPPVSPAESGGSTAAFVEETRRRMGEALAVRPTEHTREDVELMAQAQSARLPPGAGEVEFGRMRRLWQLDLGTARELLARYGEISGGAEVLNQQRFATVLGLPPDGPIVAGVFSMLQAGDPSGGVRFRDLLSLVISSSPGVDMEDRRALIFDAFDLNGDGVIQKHELEAMLSLGFTDLPQHQIDDLWGRMLRHGRDAGGSDGVDRGRFLSFLASSGQHMVLFGALSAEAAVAGSPKSHMPPDRQESFLRRRVRFGSPKGQRQPPAGH